MLKMILAALVALSLFSAQARAQQTFELWPGQTNFTSRGTFGTGSGETLQGIHASHHRGIGDNGTVCRVANMVGVLQDQNGATRETFHWVVRTGSDVDGPGVDSASLLAKVGPLQPPTGTGNHAMAWMLTTAIPTPIQLPDCRSHFSFGLQLGPAPNWVRDGLSTHTSFGAAPYSTQGTHSRAEDHAWEIVGTATAATNASHMRTWRYGLLVDNGVLQLGNGGSLYGMGGMFPAANAPVTARARYGASMSGGTSLLYMSTGRIDGFRQFFNTTRLFLGGTFYVVGAVPIPTSGEAIHTITASLPAACAGSPRHYVQALGMKGSVNVVTNSHAINP